MERVLESELMDELGADADELGRSLADLRWVNRWLGGRASAVRLVLGIASQLGKREVTILDVATGGADVPLAMLRAARKRGLNVRITATDLHPRAVEYARAATRAEPKIEVRKADALALSFGADSFDVVVCSTALHHFEEAAAIAALREMDRVARYAVVVTDLERSRLALQGARLLAATVWRRHPITRHDGPASVRAAFTRTEIGRLAEAAVSDPFVVRREAVFRLALVIDRSRLGEGVISGVGE